MVIDFHMHVNSLFLNNTEEKIKNINEDLNLDEFINVGMNYETSKESIKLSVKNHKSYSSVGIRSLYIQSQNCELYVSSSRKSNCDCRNWT